MGLIRLCSNGSRNAKMGWLVGSFSCCLAYKFNDHAHKSIVLARTQAYRTPTAPPSGESETHFTWAGLIQYLVKYWLGLSLAVVSSLLAAYFNVQIPVSIGSITSVIATMVNRTEPLGCKEYWDQIKGPALRFVAVVAAQAAATVSTISFLSNVMEQVACDIRRDLFRSLQTQDLSFFELSKTGELASRINQDVQELKSDVKKLLNSGIKSAAQTVGVFSVIYSISPTLTLSLGAGVACLVGIGSWIGKYLKQKSVLASQSSSSAQSVCFETLSNQKTVRSFSAEDFHQWAYERKTKDAAVAAQDLGYGIGIFQGLTNLALNGIVGGTVIIGGMMVSGNSMSGGDLMSFLTGVQMLQKSLATLSQMTTLFLRTGITGDRIFQFLHLTPGETVSRNNGERIPHWKLLGNVDFEDVKFSYPSRRNDPVLDGFNLSLHSHQVVALVGSSGNGKSTIAALLARLYDPDSGAVKIDGRDIRGLDARWLRGELIGYVGQEPTLFAGTVADNIRYGKPEASDAEVREAARMANADEFICALKRGYATEVGERGASLSGGQKQRIAIARAIIKNPEILIFDEATSALDTESEAVVQRAIEDNFKNRMVLVIAHRLTTVRKADVIHVVQNGRIVESGSHAKLMSKKGVYFNLHNQQH